MSSNELVENVYDAISVQNYDRGDTQKDIHQYLPDKNIKHYDIDILSNRLNEIVAEVDEVIHTGARIRNSGYSDNC